MRQATLVATRRRIPSVVVLGTLLLGCGESSETKGADVLAAQAVSLPSPKITRVTLEGSGCSEEDALIFAPNREAFAVSFRDFDVVRAARSRPAKRECTLTVAVDAPEGVSYAPAGMNAIVSGEPWSGAAFDVTVSTGGQWVGDAKPARVGRVAQAEGDQEVKRVFDEPELWSPCSGPRELRVTAGLELVRGIGSARIHELSSLQFRARPCGDVTPPADAGAPSLPDAGQPDAAAGPDAGLPPVSTSEASFVGDIQVEGRSCSGSNQAIVQLSEDRKALALDFPGFDFPESELLANCILGVNVAVPPGHRAALHSFVLEGDSELPAGFGVRLEASTYRAGPVNLPRGLKFDFDGPTSGPFTKEVSFTTLGLDYGVCGPQSFRILIAAGVRQAERTRFALRRLHSLKFAVEPCP